MLPQLPAIPIQTSDASADIARNINRTFPVGQNVSATVIAVSRDQIQPEVFRLNLEVNNRLIQMGVFQPLPVGQKINVNRQSDGQIQITLPPANNTEGKEKPQQNNQPITKNPQQASNNVRQSNTDTLLKIQLPNITNTEKLPTDISIKAAVISSRAVYPQATPTTSTPSSTATGATASAANTATPILQTPAATVNTTNNTASSTTNPPTSQTGTPASNTPAQPQSTLINSQATSSSPINTQPTTAASLVTQNTTTSPITGSTTEAAPAQTQTQTQTAQQPRSTTQTQTQQQSPSANNVASTKNETQQTTPQNQNTNNSTASTPAARPIASTVHHVVNLALPDGSKIEIISPRPLPQGTQVQFIKSDSGETHITRIQNPPLNPSSALERPGIQEALRDALPRQIPTGDAFNQLSQSANRTDTPQLTQISSVVRSMLQLFGIQPGSSDSAAQIRQNIELGGLNTERMLSKGMVQPNDLKSQLKQLQQLSENLPNEQREKMEQLLRGIHSRVTSQQLNSLQQWREPPDGGFERVLQLDLPIKQGENWENLELRLSREGGTNSAGEMISVWRIRLHFDLEDKGGLDAEIRLTDNHEISALFWCEQPETAEILKDRADEFAGRLRECGFSNSEVNWHKGTAPEQNQPIHKQLIDLHT